VRIRWLGTAGYVVQGRTTTLLIDLKRRRALNQDKLNYELIIGARRFKCTTVPIVRRDYGVVGAMCINIDINYVRDDVLASSERIQEFLARTGVPTLAKPFDFDEIMTLVECMLRGSS